MVWKTFAYGEDHPICLKVQSLNSSLLIEMGLGWANFFLWDSVFVESAHFTVWTLFGLLAFLNVVSMVSTFMPQFESCGWQVVQDARVVCPCFSWQAKQLRPS